MTRHTQDRALAMARPCPIRRPWRERVWSAYAFGRARELPLVCAWLTGLVLAVSWSTSDAIYRPLVGLWLVVGAQSLAIGSWLALDVHRRISRHERSGLVAVAGWRIAAPVDELDADLLLCIDLLGYLHDHAHLAHVPIRGRRRRARTTYAVSLRTLGRSWSRTCGVSGRRADSLLAADLCRYGAVRRAKVGQAMAFRLADDSLESALARLERASGRRVIAWSLGRDPRALSRH